MNTAFMTWEYFKPSAIRLIKVHQSELTLFYTNNAQLSLEFDDPTQMDTFVTRLLEHVGDETPGDPMWN